jgi:molybdopterin synthase catalytic subunit
MPGPAGYRGAIAVLPFALRQPVYSRKPPKIAETRRISRVGRPKVVLMMALDVKVTTDSLSGFDPEFSDRDGALVDFFGVVRGIENGRPIDGIEYQAFVEMAESELRRIAESAQRDFSLGLVLIHHRVGFVGVGEPSLFVRVTAPHRGAAFAGCQRVIEELKARVPIWKHPAFRRQGAHELT